MNTLDTIAQQKGDGNVRLSDMQNMLAEAWHLEGDIDTLGRTKQLNEVVPNVLGRILFILIPFISLYMSVIFINSFGR